MAVFYFHVMRGGTLYLDREGVDLPDEAAAHERAIEDARVLLRPDRDERYDGERRIEVSDNEGNTIFTVPQPLTFH